VGETREGWQSFGNVLERAYALLGQGRCLRSAVPGPRNPCSTPRELLASMGYKPVLEEVEGLLQQTHVTPA
jgi:hypothetical protein